MVGPASNFNLELFTDAAFFVPRPVECRCVAAVVD